MKTKIKNNTIHSNIQIKRKLKKNENNNLKKNYLELKDLGDYE